MEAIPRALVLVAVVLAGCSRDTVTATRDPVRSVETPGVAAPHLAIPARRACAVDGDCAMSCAYGAVSKTWQEDNIRQECRGGCEVGRTARCIDGECLAHREGAIDEGCSRDAPDAPTKGE